MSRRWQWAVGQVMVAVVAVCWAEAGCAAASEPAARELDTHRMLGTAHYENGDFKAAVKELRRCVELAPESAVDQFNLALALTRANQYGEALRYLDEAEHRQPNMLNVHYIRGIIHKRQGRHQQAIYSLQRVLSGDRQCWGTYYNLGVCYKFLRQHDEAKNAFEAATRIDPNHPSAHYQLIILARRTGDVEEAKRRAELFDRVKSAIDESEKTPEALERSRYSDMIVAPGLTRDAGDQVDARVRFVDVTAETDFHVPAASPLAIAPAQSVNRADYSEAYAREHYVPTEGGAVVLGDYDGDGDLDLYVVSCAAARAASVNHLYRNDGSARFTNVTALAGVGDEGMGMDAVFGDYDNDGDTDLYVVNYGPNVLYENDGKGKFFDVSKQSRADEPQFGRQVLLVDYDHDNDLDILVVNDTELTEPPQAEPISIPRHMPGQINALLRNNGNGTFTDQTDEAGLLVDCSQSRAAAFTDFDGDHDADLFIANFDGPSLFFANARLGRLVTGGEFYPKITSNTRAVASGDFDRDGDSDLVVAVGQSLHLYVNDGKASFKRVPIPIPPNLTAAGVRRIRVFDHDNDGWSDLLLLDTTGHSLCLLTGASAGQFRNATVETGLSEIEGWIANITTGDLDGDGDEDIILLTRDRGLLFLRSDGEARRHWIDVRLAGRKVNRSAYGATVEVAAVGGHYQRQTMREGRVHFGLGSLERVDIVRIVWPNGVAQNVIRPKIDCGLKVTEKIRVSASCAFLWTDNGSEFELVNEILGVGPLGVPMAPGVYHQPDCTELTKIEARQLVPRDGAYNIRITQELRETVYADKMTLRLVDHPAGLEVIPNEMFTAPPFPDDKFFAVSEHRAPRLAVDDRGQDVLPLVLERDDKFPTFPLTQYEGLAQLHSITLDLGALSGAEHIMLYLDGWIYWPESSTVMAIAQDSRFTIAPLSLQVCDSQGRWRAAIESVGLPTSKGMVVPVDLTGKFLCQDFRVRLSTNLCVYFDRIFVSTRDRARQCRVTDLPVAHGDLHYRGFCRMTRDRFGFERFHYADAAEFVPWHLPRGMFTRYGDITALLASEDNQFVIFGSGDELTLRFDAQRLPTLPHGWVRDFIFYANGWVKDGDLNTKWSETVEPLPFHGMSAYPYGASEHYPQTPEMVRYMQTYNTRPSWRTVGRLPSWPD
jgi:Flp pilus assembly protein TadD